MSCLFTAALCIWQSAKSGLDSSSFVICLLVTCAVAFFASWSNTVELIYRRRISIASASLTALFVTTIAVASVVFWEESTGSDEEWSPMDSRVISGPVFVAVTACALLSMYGLHSLMRISDSAGEPFLEERQE